MKINKLLDLNDLDEDLLKKYQENKYLNNLVKLRSFIIAAGKQRILSKEELVSIEMDFLKKVFVMEIFQDITDVSFEEFKTPFSIRQNQRMGSAQPLDIDLSLDRLTTRSGRNFASMDQLETLYFSLTKTNINDLFRDWMTRHSDLK